jgi:hypothetical protein
MGHPAVENLTQFTFEPLHVADEEGRPIVATLVKGTFELGADGRLRPAAEQQPVLFAGVFNGEPEVSSYRFEPEVAFVKPATDVALVGHAHARTRGQTESLVGLRVGTLSKEVLVTGDRVWQSSWLGKRIGPPAAFERIPLQWERAFGGWDRTHEDPARHSYEPRNPVGVGYRAKFAAFQEGAALPNIEEPDDRQTRWTGRAQPAGFGFVGAHWQPRARFAGTFDERWAKTRKPRLPADFDRRFFNSAAPGLTAPGHLAGGESVVVQNAAPMTLTFALPSAAAPRCRLELRHGPDVDLALKLDTVVIDADLMRVVLTWRAHTTLREGPLDVRSYLVAPADDPVWSRAVSAPTPP